MIADQSIPKFVLILCSLKSRLVLYWWILFLPNLQVWMFFFLMTTELILTTIVSFTTKSWPDPLENCHLNVKKMPKTWLFFSQKIAKNGLFKKNCQFFYIQMAIFQRFRSRSTGSDCAIIVDVIGNCCQVCHLLSIDHQKLFRSS